MITVLIVDDSPTARLALRQGFRGDPEVHVIGEAPSGAEALRQIRRRRPDLVTMDVHLERENGIKVTETIMSSLPRPVLIVTGVNPKDPRLIYRALQAGALEVAPKLPAPNHPDYPTQRDRLVRLVKTLARIPVVTRRGRPAGPRPAIAKAGQDRQVAPSPSPRQGQEPAVLLVGASTGGPPLLKDLLQALQPPYPLPIGVVQHISAGFGRGLGEWLASTTGHEVIQVTRARRLRPGEVYLAPDRRHLHLSTADTIAPLDDADVAICPSVDVLFESAAARLGSRAAALLLTGMGRDGARGMAALRQAGAVTVAQSPDSCAVSGMPQAAIDLGAAQHVLSPQAIFSMFQSP